MKKSLLILLFFLSGHFLFAQKAGKEGKIVIITFDGYRWKDLFRGADSALFFSANKGAKDSADVIGKFWGNSAVQRREKLMPFFWSTIAGKGQVYGNRDLGSNVNVKNPYWFSYPGYNEIFTGYPDTLINSNGYPPNPNITLQEYVNRMPAFKGKVAAFTSWLAFNNILNAGRSGFLINAGYTPYEAPDINEAQKVLNQTQALIPKPFGDHERPDAITYLLAKEYMQQHHPRVLQISFIETDAWAHRGNYNAYLESAHSNDAMLEDIWKYIQSDPFYKDQTTLYLANDHGRGDDASWMHHNSKTPGSDQIWFAVMGPYTRPLGETKNVQLYQNQYAKTMAALLGVNFVTQHPAGEAIRSVIDK